MRGEVGDGLDDVGFSPVGKKAKIEILIWE